MHALHASLAAEYIALDSQEAHLSLYPIEVSQLTNTFIHADEDYDGVFFQSIANRLNTRYGKSLRFQDCTVFDRCTRDHLIYEIQNTGMTSLAAARTLRVQVGEQTMLTPAVVYKLIHLIDDLGTDVYFSVKHVLPISGNLCHSRSKYQVFYPISGEIFFDTEQDCFHWIKSLVTDLGLNSCVIYSFTKINPLLLQEEEKWREQEIDRRIEVASRPLPEAVGVRKFLKNNVAPIVAQDPIGMAVAFAKHLTHGTFLENIVEKTERQIQAVKLKSQLKKLNSRIAPQLTLPVSQSPISRAMDITDQPMANSNPTTASSYIGSPLQKKVQERIRDTHKTPVQKTLHRAIQSVDRKIRLVQHTTSHNTVRRIFGSLHCAAKRTDEFVMNKKKKN